MAIDHSLRVGTFNTQLDSWIFKAAKDPSDLLLHRTDWPEHFRSRTDTAAWTIATRIRDSKFRYDVIGLNEVFDEGARRIIVDLLRDEFPHQVTKSPEIDVPLPADVLVMLEASSVAIEVIKMLLPDEYANGLLTCEDSGLMLLSRFPIVRTRFVPFSVPPSGHPDRLASKGVLYAELFNTKTEVPLHVFLTHLQDHDDKKPEWADIRRSECAEIGELAREVTWGRDLTLEDVVLMGDMNIVANHTPAMTMDGQPYSFTKDAAEYVGIFGTSAPASFFRDTMKDTWITSTSPKDLGRTSSQGGSELGNRLDLLLHNSGDRRLVPQHVTLAWNLYASGERQSDHMGVNAIFNAPTDHATALAAQRIVIDRDKPPAHPDSETAEIDDLHDGIIEHPHGMQWFRIDHPGGYSIAAHTKAPQAFKLQADLYAADDLSRPLAQYDSTTRRFYGPDQQVMVATTYALPDPTYYVRVSVPHDMDWTGPYTLLVHRHQGVSPRDAIPMPAYVPTLFAAAIKAPHNSIDGVWGKISYTQANSGRPQTMALHAAVGSQPLTLEVRTTNEVNVIGSATPDPSGSLDLTWPQEGTGFCYVLLLRHDPSFTSPGAGILWTTDLTYFHGSPEHAGAQQLLLHCDNECDPEWGGADSIRLDVWADDIQLVEKQYIGDFNEGDDHSVALPPIAYVDSLSCRLWEHDDGPDDPSPIVTVGPLREAGRRDQITFDFGGGVYFLWGQFSHHL